MVQIDREQISNLQLSNPHVETLNNFAEYLRHAEGLLITAGAGMGVDSGLADFRGDSGLWTAYPPLQTLNKQVVDMMQPTLFIDEPRLAWGFYGGRLNEFRAVTPHDGFYALKALADRMPKGAFVFTSNVDGEFQKAGFTEEQVFECHGSVHWLQCFDNCHQGIWSAEDFHPVVDEQCNLLNDPPTCPHCGRMARPHTLMFNDWQWQDEKSADRHRRMNEWLAGVNRLAIIEVGAGTVVPSVRNFGEKLVRYKGAKTVRLLRINRSEAQLPEGHDMNDQHSTEQGDILQGQADAPYLAVQMGAKDALTYLAKQVLPLERD